MKRLTATAMQPAPDITINDSPCLAAGADKLLRRLFFLIPLGIIGNVIFSLVSADRAAVHSLVHFAPGYLAFALLLSIVPWFTGSLRLYLWSRFLGGDIRYRDTFKIALGAELGAAVSPPFIGGSPVKIMMLMRRGFPTGKALSLTVLESTEDAFFFLVMVPVTLTLSSSWDLPLVKNGMEGLYRLRFWLPVLATGAAFPAGILLFCRRAECTAKWLPFMRPITERIRDSYRHFADAWVTIICKGKRFFALTMTLTALQWVCRYSIITLLLMGLGIPVRPLLFMALQVIVFALMTFIPSPGGAGGAEALFYITYRSLLPADALGLVTAGWRFLTFYFLLLVASALLLLFSREPSARQATGTDVIPFAEEKTRVTRRRWGYPFQA